MFLHFIPYTGKIAACEFHVKRVSREIHVTISREIHMKQISREIHVKISREFHVKLVSREIHTRRFCLCNPEYYA